MSLGTGALVVRKKLRPGVAGAHIKQEAESDEEGRGRDDEDDERRGHGEGQSNVARGARGGGERRRGALTEKGKGSPPSEPRFAHLSLYEERVLLRRLEACPQALAVTAQAKRLHRKLLVRKAKRQRGLPLLDIDQAVSATLSLVGGLYGAQEGGQGRYEGSGAGKYRTTSQDLRILDRFQVHLHYHKHRCQICAQIIHKCMHSLYCWSLWIKTLLCGIYDENPICYEWSRTRRMV